VEVDLAGTVVSTWAYGDTISTPALRARVGERLRVELVNRLPEPTSVHWHGLAVPNDQDGVPGLTTPEVAAGGSFTYDFVVPNAGTHWLHPHHGLQMDRGLYAPLVVDDPAEPGGYDSEWVLVLDDWTDGVGPSPDQIFTQLRGAAGRGMGMGMGGGTGMPGGMHMGHGSSATGGGGDVDYPLYLINGRTGSDPDVLRARPGQRVRLRIINAAADTIFDVGLAGHRLHVTHSDGFPIEPLDTASVRLGMGERYDALVAVQDGAFPFVAAPVGKTGLAQALLRTSDTATPADAGAAMLDVEPLTAGLLRCADGSALPAHNPDTVQDVLLSGGMGEYVWTINRRTYDEVQPLTIRAGQAGRLRIANHSMMSHPVHLHGHTFQLGPAGGGGARKDTVLVPPMAGLEVDLLADNPGRWMLHCHNAYHAEAGMMTRLDYQT
jgi:FtsP/CotA-like multicopper oxidase with cupredoxin domain